MNRERERNRDRNRDRNREREGKIVLLLNRTERKPQWVDERECGRRRRRRGRWRRRHSAVDAKRFPRKVKILDFGSIKMQPWRNRPFA